MREGIKMQRNPAHAWSSENASIFLHQLFEKPVFPFTRFLPCKIRDGSLKVFRLVAQRAKTIVERFRAF